MKRQWMIATLTALALAGAGLNMNAQASEYGTQAGAKFSRGIANLSTGWVEVPKNIANESRERNIGTGLTWGAVKGSVHAVGRTLVGAFDTATFFIPSQSQVHSNYVWDEYSHETTYGAQ